VSRDERLRIAVFIDFDNIEIGVKNTLGASFDAGLVLEALKERGEVVSKTAYSDWQRAGGYSRMLTQHAIRMVQRNLTPGGDKNGADINLALDALEMAFTHTHINAFVIVGGDSDFISLVEKLKQYDKQVFIVGGRQFTSGILQRNCHEFIAYENLVGASSGRRQVGRDVKVDRAPIDQAVPLVARALQVLSERDVSPQLGLLKTTLLQLDSTFSERTYGASSFRDFAQKLEKAGVLKVTQGKGGWLVGPADGAAGTEAAATPEDPELARSDTRRPRPVHEGRPQHQPHSHHEARETAAADARPASGHHTAGPARVVGTPAEGVREFKRLLSAAEIRRWPLYLRNVKQLLRQVSPTFDERSYGFGNLVDLLRAAQKEGAVRVERDRQGVIRVFQGAPAAAAPAPAAPVEPSSVSDVIDAEVVLEPEVVLEEEPVLQVAVAAAEIGVSFVPVPEATPHSEAPRTPARGRRSKSATAASEAAPRAPRRRSRAKTS